MALSGGTEQKIQFEIGKIYLVENYYYHTNTYQEVYVDRITDVAYKLRKERTDGTWYIEWDEKEKFHDRHNIIQCLDSPLIPPSLLTAKIEINNPEYLKALTTPCPVCNGTGRVPDDSSTAGDKPCPKCWGSGIIYAVQ